MSFDWLKCINSIWTVKKYRCTDELATQGKSIYTTDFGRFFNFHMAERRK